MKFDLIQIAAIIAIMQTLIIGVYLINQRKGTSGVSISLALLIFTYSVLILCSLVLSSGINPGLFLPAHIAGQCALLIGPLVYFFISLQVSPAFTFKKKHLLHIIPFILSVVYLTIKFYFVPIPVSCRSNHIFIGSLTFVHTFAYFMVAHRKLREKGLIPKQVFSSNGENSMAGLPLLIYGCSVFWLTKLLFFVVWDISGYYKGCNELINLHFLTLFLLFNIFLFFLLSKPQLFLIKPKYKHSVLSDTFKREYVKMLVQYMENEKAYRDSLLSLKSIARQLSIGERYLSQIINESFNENFYSFINRYRIEESKKIIRSSNGRSKTLLAIAYEVGFNSKSTFNSAFKKYTDYTPKEYRALHCTVPA